MDGPLQRNFPKAILTAVERVKAKSPPNGAVMLLVKYGADISSFGMFSQQFHKNVFNDKF